MMVEEKLEWLDGHWVRADEFCLWPLASSFTGFASQVGGTGGLVTDAPELAGRILDQDDGRPFRAYIAAHEAGDVPLGLPLTPGR